MKMKVLLIGGTSSLAISLKPVLAGFCDVITAGRKDCNVYFNLTDPIEKMILPENIDTIIHTAAHLGGKSEPEIFDAENVNVLGTLKLAQVAMRLNVRHFILISSIFSTLKENHSLYNIYALSKKHSEEIANIVLKNKIQLTILRPSQIYGDTDLFRINQPFFYSIVDKAERGEDIHLYGSNDARRNYIHIDDLVHIISETVKHKIEGVFACMNPKDVKYSQIAHAAIAAFESSSSVQFLKDKADIPNNVFDKEESLYKIINFFPQVSIDEGMRKIARYRRSLR